MDKIEMVQRRAVRFTSNLKERGGGTSERDALGLELLQRNSRKDARVKLLLKIPSSDANNSPLADNFNNIIAQQTPLHSHVTRSVTSSKPLEITATKQMHFNSFLPKTSRGLRKL